MYVGKKHAGESWIDVLQNHKGKVVINNHGYGCFFVSRRSVSVWVNAYAKGLDMFGSL
jgi:alpha-amylase